eukprot:364369-Chlamydomonas_euryale.AAC.4
MDAMVRSVAWLPSCSLCHGCHSAVCDMVATKGQTVGKPPLLQRFSGHTPSQAWLLRMAAATFRLSQLPAAMRIKV